MLSSEDELRTKLGHLSSAMSNSSDLDPIAENKKTAGAVSATAAAVAVHHHPLGAGSKSHDDGDKAASVSQPAIYPASQQPDQYPHYLHAVQATKISVSQRQTTAKCPLNVQMCSLCRATWRAAAAFDR